MQRGYGELVKENIRERFREAQNSLVIQASDLSLGSITEMVDAGAIDLDPHYQRRLRWGSDKQSRLIESFLLNVPVPPLYFAEEDFGRYSVIDGKQRVTAVHEFMTGNLVLKGLESFSEINSHRFDELPSDLQNALRVRPYLRVVTLLRQSNQNLKYEVFLRLNTGGDRLLPQEIRNVAFSGPFNDLLIRLAEHPFLRHKLKITGQKSPAYQSMDDVEHVLRFLTTNFCWHEMGGSLSRAMDSFMQSHRSATQAECDEFASLFNSSIDSCSDIWGEHAFERPADAKWRNQMISPLYDAQMVALATLDAAERARAVLHREDVIQATRELFDRDEEFVKSVSRATNNAASVQKRITAFIELFKAVLA